MAAQSSNEVPLYVCRVVVVVQEKKAEVMVLVGPKQGLSLLADYKNNVVRSAATRMS